VDSLFFGDVGEESELFGREEATDDSPLDDSDAIDLDESESESYIFCIYIEYLFA
jgi:hypothetical protein